MVQESKLIVNFPYSADGTFPTSIGVEKAVRIPAGPASNSILYILLPVEKGSGDPIARSINAPVQSTKWGKPRDG